MHELISIISPFVAIFVTSFITYFFHLISKLIKGKIQNQKIKEAFFIISETVNAVVGEINQTIVSDIKEKSRDGKLTEKEVLAVRTQALNKIKNQIPEEVCLTAASINKGLDNFIKSKIEGYIFEQKGKY